MRMNESIPGTKIAERLFARPEGATMAEVVAATGGRQHNLLERLKARGYAVRSRKEGNTTRYWVQRPGKPAYEATVTSKGQITLPKEVRDALGVRAGEKLSIAAEDGKAVLARKRSTIDDIFGILHRPGMRAVTVEEMDEGIKKAVVGRYLRAVGRRK
jgi:AbrB family looped-hinge helix DNA binding protein